MCTQIVLCWYVQNEKFSLFISKFIKMTHPISVLQIIIENKSDRNGLKAEIHTGL